MPAALSPVGAAALFLSRAATDSTLVSPHVLHLLRAVLQIPSTECWRYWSCSTCLHALLRQEESSSSGSEGEGAKLQRLAARRRGRLVLEEEGDSAGGQTGAAKSGSAPEQPPPAKRPRSAQATQAEQPKEQDAKPAQRTSVLDEADSDDDDDWAVPSDAPNSAQAPPVEHISSVRVRHSGSAVKP